MSFVVISHSFLLRDVTILITQSEYCFTVLSAQFSNLLLAVYSLSIFCQPDSLVISCVFYSSIFNPWNCMQSTFCSFCNCSSLSTSCMALVTFLIMFSISFIKNTPFKSYITLKRGVSCIFSLFIPV